MRGLQPDQALLALVNSCFDDIIAFEETNYQQRSDHFSSGANSRIWNAFEKLCNHNPEAFIRYYANPLLDTICQSWLGPYYQMTSQVNIVRPGGKAQVVHRDYHLGFQEQSNLAQFPIKIHVLSPYLTLQGAIAHTEVTAANGATQLLPYSHLLDAGYIAVYQDAYREYFDTHYVQLDLHSGDGLFFNPSVFHAAGANVTESVHRSANLLQIVSALSRAMEVVDRKKMTKDVYPYLQTTPLEQNQLNAIVSMVADGYPFPTNLDIHPPHHNAMTSDQVIVHQALVDLQSPEQLNHSIDNN